MLYPHIILPLQMVVANNVRFLLNLLGFSVGGENFLIETNNMIFFISEDCTGWKSMLLMFALIFSVPNVEIKKRLIGLAFSLPSIYIGNLFRILLVVWIWEVYGLSFALLFHNYFWQLGLISLVLFLWLFWLFWVGKLKGFKNKETINKPKTKPKVSK
jgi:exosortase/archaeosortase family protein